MGWRHGRVQRLRRLVLRRSLRQAERVFVLEGAKVVSVALDAGVPLEGVYLAPAGRLEVGAGAVAERALCAGTRVHYLAEGVMERVAGTVTPQPVLALAPFLDVGLGELRGARAVVVCAGVRDPGNAGTILRSAEAAGAGGVVFCAGSVEVYNPKVVRASAGAVCQVPVVVGGEPAEVLGEIGGWGARRLAAVARGGQDYREVDLGGQVALVLGNEAAGLAPELEGLVDAEVTIPMPGRAESLNVGVTAALLCFEVARRGALATAAPALGG